ncbi:hypothetical protein OS493_035657 [Desmophyllum pertusum]|uniref:Uncharacterized protein n=1 Tax=Desmophyllum pertusum TaxID=174260 RepID=A0A9W9Z7D2_9CNID|nr:hypothetical protein OS493_035657 [Desmophyllum pertusum]
MESFTPISCGESEHETGSTVVSDSSEDSEHSDEETLLSARQVRSVYLITYSQADVDLVPTREEFSRVVLESFANADPCSRCEVVQWVCSQEAHRERGIHYHMAVKLSARRRKKEGKTDLAEFIANRGGKAVDDALSVGWEMEEAEAKLERAKLSRTEILYREMGKECVDGCNRRWLEMAEDILQRNNIDKVEFAEAIQTLLEKGRESIEIFFERPREL